LTGKFLFFFEFATIQYIASLQTFSWTRAAVSLSVGGVLLAGMLYIRNQKEIGAKFSKYLFAWHFTFLNFFRNPEKATPCTGQSENRRTVAVAKYGRQTDEQ
jgi:hypothetical protein